MSKVIDSINQNMRVTTEGLFAFSLKVFSGLIVSLTISLIFQEIIGYGTFSLILVSTTLMLGLLKMFRAWRVTGILVFDLVCVLVALLLRMYILVAPGA